MNPFEPYSTAKGYGQSAFLIMSNPQRSELRNDIPFVLSVHMLVGFAVELYAKAVLADAGFSEDDLAKRPFGHDLRQLHAACVAEGFSNEGLQWLVELVGDMHKDLGFRYVKPSANYTAGNPKRVFASLSDLDIAVDFRIGASAAGKAPSSGWVLPPSLAGWHLPNDPA